MCTLCDQTRAIQMDAYNLSPPRNITVGVKQFETGIPCLALYISFSYFKETGETVSPKTKIISARFVVN